MHYRVLGRTGLRVSEIGLGGEWLNGLTAGETRAVLDAALENGINLMDVFMPQAPTRDHIGEALKGRREKMILQGHLCTVYEDGQYTRTRDMEKTRRSFQDLLDRLQTDYIDIGMIHYVDSQEDFDLVFGGPVMAYARELKEKGIIRHIGMSSHNPHIALQAAQSGLVDVLMFSINPAYDMEAADTEIDDLIDFKGMEKSGLVVDEARQTLYSQCEALGVAITVMKPPGSRDPPEGGKLSLWGGHDCPPVHPVLPGPERRQVRAGGLPYPPGGAGSGAPPDPAGGGAELFPYFRRRSPFVHDGKVYVLQPLPALSCPPGHCRHYQVSGPGPAAGPGAGNGDGALLVFGCHGGGLPGMRPL